MQRAAVTGPATLSIAPVRRYEWLHHVQRTYRILAETDTCAFPYTGCFSFIVIPPSRLTLDEFIDFRLKKIWSEIWSPSRNLSNQTYSIIYVVNCVWSSIFETKSYLKLYYIKTGHLVLHFPQINLSIRIKFLNLKLFVKVWSIFKLFIGCF